MSITKQSLQRARGGGAIVHWLPMRKRDIRGGARTCSLCGAALLAVNVLTFHSIESLPWASGVLLLLSAIANLVAAFAEDLSVRSFFASITDLGLAFGAGICFMMQVGAAEVSNTSRALSMGMHLLALIIEVFVIAFDAGMSVVGLASDEILDKSK